MRLLIITCLFIATFISSCSEKDSLTKSGESFFDKTAQQLNDRVFLGELKPVKSQNLDSLDIIASSFLKSNHDHLFLSSGRLKKIFVIDKEDLSRDYTISIDEGRGPGEVVGFNDFDVSSNFIAIVDNPGLKILILDAKGNFVNEYFPKEGARPARVALVGDDNILVYTPITPEFLFNTSDLEGNTISGFSKLGDLAGHNALKYTGRVVVKNNHLYFAGRSESILKKYNIDGDLIFSRTTVDDWPDNINYVVFEAGEGQIGTSYSEGALFAFNNFDVWDNFIVTIPHHNGDPDYKYLDIYSRSDGNYLGTLTTDEFPYDITIDDEFIYIQGNLPEERTIKKYPNELSQYFEK